jgi:hypothetical protein
MSVTEAADWCLFGYGKVAQEVVRQIGLPGAAERLGLSPLPRFVVRNAGIMEPDGVTPSGISSLADIGDFPRMSFLAVDSTNDGVAEFEHLSHIFDRPGTVAATCAKGGLANFFTQLRMLSGDFRRLGYNGACGGGTRMIDSSRVYTRDVANISQIHIAPNGTMASTMSLVGPRGDANGLSLGQAIEHAIALKYADPGSESPEDVIRLESTADTPKKTAIYYNALELGPTILDWRELEFDMTDADIRRLKREARERRLIVSLYAARFHPNIQDSIDEEDIISGRYTEHDDWHIVQGYQHVDQNPLLADLARLTGPGNGAVIGLGPNEENGVYHINGPGAGVRPTVATMLYDWLRLRSEIS